jgi:4-carboxymuconolactone decarboxylase
VSRLADLNADRLEPDQRRVYDEIAAAHRGEVRGPWPVQLRIPEVAHHVHALYERLCVNSKVGRRLFELMVLIVARHWSSQFEWFAHESQGLKAGLSPEVIEAIRDRRVPDFIRDDERLVFDIITELNTTHTLSQKTYDRSVAALGEDHLVELVTGAGVYTMIAMQLNAFDVSIPKTARPL